MNLIKCINNHYYNADRLPNCPHCIHQNAKIPLMDLEGLQQGDIPTYSDSDSPDTGLSVRKTVGWLVCISGRMVGANFTLYEGANHIGRSHYMNVCLSKEPTVSRERHATITYNTNTNQFILSSLKKDITVLLNNTPLTDSTRINHHDYIQLGECRLLFIPLCDDTFCW